MDGGGVGGWYSWQKEPRAAHWFFLFQIKKGTSKLTKMAILRKKGTLGSQWQSLINSQPTEFEIILSSHTCKSRCYRAGYSMKNLAKNHSPAILGPLDDWNSLQD